MRALYDNKYQDATLTTKSENADYPISNTQDSRASRVYRTNDDFEQHIIASNLSGITASYVAIINHNLSDSAVLKIQAMDADSFVDSNDQPQWEYATLDETIPITDYIIVHNFTEQTFTHWRIWVDDSNDDGYIEFGVVFLGTYLQLPYMLPNQEIGYDTESTTAISLSGQAYGDGAYNFRAPKINIAHATNADKDSMKTMFDSIKTYNPFILIIWEGAISIENPIYCVMTKAPKFKRSGSYTHPWGYTMEIREVF